MVDTSVITDVNNLLTALTVTVIPAFLGLATGIINFVQHHTNRSDIKAGAARDAEYIQKFAELDKKIAAKSGDIAIGAGVVSEQFPQVKDAIVKHEAQLNNFDGKLKSLADEIQRLKALIPAN